MISLYQNYDPSLGRLETRFPLAFPWNDTVRQDVPRFYKDADGWWRNSAAYPNGKALINCTGDLMCEPKLTRANRYGDSYFFHPMFQFVRPILKSGDFTVGNLETTISDTTPYAGTYHNVARQYHCNGPAAYLDALRYAGFDALVNANNHNCDSGAAGLIETNESIDARGFMRTGTFLPGETERAILAEVNGIRLAVLSYATAFNRLDSNFTEAGKTGLLNAYSPEKAKADVAWARERGAEYVISYIHWGKSYVHYPTGLQKEQAQGLADAGVDYIIGSHSHCLQVNGTVHAKDGRQVPVIYSMGNFVTNESQDLCLHCGVLQLSLVKENGKITCTDRFIPCLVMNEFGTGRFCNVPVDTAYNGGYDHPELHRSREFAARYVSIPAPTSGAMTVAEACRLWGVEVPAGMAYRGFSKISLQGYLPEDRMLYFADGKETDLEMLQLRRRDGITIVTETAWDQQYACVVVPDVKKAYETLCTHLRDRFDASCVMVIGGSGKTAARSLITGVLKQKYRTLTHGDGVMIDSAVWRFLHPGTEWFVQEVRPGTRWGYDTQSRILKPQILVMTSDCVHTKDALVGMPDGGLVLCNSGDAALTEKMKKLAAKHPRLRFAAYGPAEASGLLMEQAAGAALAVAKELGIHAVIPEYKGLEQSVLPLGGLLLVLHTACKSLGSAKAALEEARKLGSRVVAIGDLRFASVLDGADVLLTTQTFDDRAQRHDAEHALERQALEVLQPGDTVLLCGMRDVTLNTTVRRLFGLTDGIISDIW